MSFSVSFFFSIQNIKTKQDKMKQTPKNQEDTSKTKPAVLLWLM